ncbi:MAG: nucleotidyltransferase domain-containing protein [Anaerolineae bacterium]|nr:nucleotidyltransferase domain-containing protein [Anaerolineae bacterium]
MKSFGSVKIISLDRDELMARLRAIATRIRNEHSEVEQVRVFGSLARGDATGTSDVDVLILLRHSTEADPLQRIRAFLPYFDLERGTDLLVFTRAELEEQLAARNMFFHHLWHESIPL